MIIIKRELLVVFQTLKLSELIIFNQEKMFTFNRIPCLMIMLLCFSSITICRSYNSQQQKPRAQIRNILSPNHPIEVQFTVFNSTHHIYSKNYTTVYSSSTEEVVIPVTVEIFESMDNLTLEASIFYEDQNTLQMAQAWKGQAKDLTKFKKISKMNSQQFFASGQIGSGSGKSQKGNYSLHIAEDFNIMILESDMRLPGEYAPILKKINFTVTDFEFNGRQFVASYLPRLDISQLHIPYKYYKPISGLLNGNETEPQNQTALEQQNLSRKQIGIKNHTIKIHIYPYGLMKYATFFQMFDPSMRQEAVKLNPLMSIVDQEALDDMKELLFTNNIYVVAVTMIMTLLKTGLEIFALKNEFKVWNEIEKNKGLSLKILYTDLLFQVVFFLYLVDNESNMMMTIPMAFGILVVLWKIKKTIYIQKSGSFPFVKLRHYDWCKHHEKIDNQGVTYMYYGLILLFVGYLGYEIIFKADSMSLLSYSSLLEKVVFFMGMAGFIRMTPQLYINYKLKSVDHLPWRTLIYRFIETIIDDFYVFLVTTPLLHKIMVFREDVIFILYLYQRVIYKTDPNRIGTAGGMVLEKKDVDRISGGVSNDRIKNQ